MIYNKEFAYAVKKKLEVSPSTLNLAVSGIQVRKTRFEKIKKLAKQPKHPWEIAQEWQALHGTVSLDVLIEEYLDTGYIYSTPNLFMLAKKVSWNCVKEEIDKDGEPNAWFVNIGVTKGINSSVKALLQMAPYPLEWVVWKRRGIYKAYKWDKLATKVKL